MAKVDSVTPVGASGSRYSFDVYPWGQAFRPIGGVYVVLRRQANGRYDVLYVGQTGDLSERFDQHHKQPCFDRNQRTHIGILLEGNEQRRLSMERDLLGNYRTVCNF